MKRTCVIILALVSVSVMGFAQNRRATRVMKDRNIFYSHWVSQYVSLGVRSGVSLTYGTPKDVKFGIDLDEQLDVQYEFYRHAKTASVGFATGLTCGFQQLRFKQPTWESTYSVSTDCGVIDYTNTAINISEIKRYVAAEVPFMFAVLSDNGFFFRIGPRIAIPVWKQGTLSFSQPNVDAYFKEEDVHVHNELITGKAVAQASRSIAWNAPTLIIKAGMELGGAITLHNSDLIQLGVYCDWGGYSIYTNKSFPNMIEVIPPFDSDTKPADVSYHSPSDFYAQKIGRVNVGIKLSYCFNLLQ